MDVPGRPGHCRHRNTMNPGKVPLVHSQIRLDAATPETIKNMFSTTKPPSTLPPRQSSAMASDNLGNQKERTAATTLHHRQTTPLSLVVLTSHSRSPSDHVLSAACFFCLSFLLVPRDYLFRIFLVCVVPGGLTEPSRRGGPWPCPASCSTGNLGKILGKL